MHAHWSDRDPRRSNRGHSVAAETIRSRTSLRRSGQRDRSAGIDASVCRRRCDAEKDCFAQLPVRQWPYREAAPLQPLTRHSPKIHLATRDCLRCGLQPVMHLCPLARSPLEAGWYMRFCARSTWAGTNPSIAADSQYCARRFDVGQVSELPKARFMPCGGCIAQTLADGRRIEASLCTGLRHAGDSFIASQRCWLRCAHVSRPASWSRARRLQRVPSRTNACSGVFSLASKLETRQSDVGISVVCTSPRLKHGGRLLRYAARQTEVRILSGHCDISENGVGLRAP